MKWLLFALVGLAAAVGHAQDYVVLNTQDTLQGKVKLMSYDLLDRVQIQNDRKQVLTALQVRAVRLEGVTYRPVRQANAVRFMQELQSGYLSFFAYRMGNSTRFDGRLLQLANQNQIDLPNIGFKKQLSEFLQECPSVSEDIKEGKLGRNDIDSIIQVFNACIDKRTLERATAPATPPAASAAIAELTRLQQELSEADFPNKKDAEDMLADIIKRSSNNETLPNYLLEGFTNLLSAQPELLEKWKAVRESLKKGG
ncbi:MAG: hypothetical protein JNL17_00140 [Cyclobacteriaceae bacterium]|nr:hypothetical protein [Cyclobacteriaceae bacterium]